MNLPRLLADESFRVKTRKFISGHAFKCNVTKTSIGKITFSFINFLISDRSRVRICSKSDMYASNLKKVWSIEIHSRMVHFRCTHTTSNVSMPNEQALTNSCDREPTLLIRPEMDFLFRNLVVYRNVCLPLRCICRFRTVIDAFPFCPILGPPGTISHCK